MNPDLLKQVEMQIETLEQHQAALRAASNHYYQSATYQQNMGELAAFSFVRGYLRDAQEQAA